jgi:hypothetical protein
LAGIVQLPSVTRRTTYCKRKFATESYLRIGLVNARASRRFSRVAVFYDKNDQHLILGVDIETYLAAIYQSEARFVVPLLSKTFPKKIWTKFESEQFKDRFGDNSVIPIWFADAPPGVFDETSRIGGFSFDPRGDLEKQIAEICRALIRRVGDERREEQQATETRSKARDDEVE